MIKQSSRHLPDVKKYTDAVRSGRRLAGYLERCAVERYIGDLSRCNSQTCHYTFDVDAADRVCDFFELLTHSEGEWAGKAFALYPWQKFVVYNLFGFRKRANHLRRFREGFLSLGRGNGKTPFGAGLLLYLLACDDPPEAGAQVYTAATKREQADLSFSTAKRFVGSSAGLSRLIRCYKFDMVVDQTHSKLKPLASEAKSADGLNIHGLLIDELHAWSEYQREFREKLKTGMKRAQSLAVTITTAGSDESDLWRQEYEFATAVVDQKRNVQADTLFVYITQADEDDDPLDVVAWHKANPMLEYGVVKAEHIQQLADKAKVDPAYRRELIRYHCNRLVTSDNKTFTADDWAKGSGPLPNLNNRPCFAGVDLGWRDDLAAIGYCWALDDVEHEGETKRQFAVAADVFVPREGRRDLTAEPWASWIEQGWLTVTDSEWTDPAVMYQAIQKRIKSHGIKSLAYDPNNAREFALNCVNNLGVTSYAFAQKPAKYNEPFREFAIAMREGRIRHGDNPLLEWCALNVVELSNAVNERMPAKSRSSDKIDPIVAIIMALSEAMFAERKKPSVYERRGPVLIG